MTISIGTEGPLDSREGLLEELFAIEAEGWGGPRGERLLSYVRSHIVAPQVAAAGLRGPAADQAEATGWAVAWETMATKSIRAARSPWGVLWIAVRRAIMGEVVASAPSWTTSSWSLTTPSWSRRRRSSPVCGCSSSTLASSSNRPAARSGS